MYFKVILISIIVVAIWVNVIQPMIEDWKFKWKMGEVDEEAEALKGKNHETYSSYEQTIYNLENTRFLRK